MTGKGKTMRVRNRLIRNAINRVSSVIGLGPVAHAPVPADGRILFHERDRKDFGFLSNFHGPWVEIDEERWPTVEHHYQAQKSHDPDYRQGCARCPVARASQATRQRGR